MNRTADPNSSRKVFDRLTPAAAQEAAAFHADVVRSVEQAVATQSVVVVGMAQNPHVKRTRKALDSAGISYAYLEYGSYLSKWRERLAIKLWTGWPTFPQVFVGGTLIGGADNTTKAIQDGSLQRMAKPAAIGSQGVLT